MQRSICTSLWQILTQRTTHRDARNASSGLKWARSHCSPTTYQRGHGGSLAWITLTSMATRMSSFVTISLNSLSFTECQNVILVLKGPSNWPFLCWRLSGWDSIRQWTAISQWGAYQVSVWLVHGAHHFITKLSMFKWFHGTSHTDG